MSGEKETVQHLDTKRSSSDAESGIDLAYEKKIIKRVDWRLLPILGALYSVALIDRTNMSNAAIAGMTKDLRLDIGDRYSIALLMFFIPYFLFELPSNIVLRKVGAARWLSFIVLSWGVVMIGMGFVKSWVSLVICRTVLGFFEAGFFPACVYLVSCWYVRFEVQKRMAAFYLVSVLVGGFSAILAYGLMQMKGIAGLNGWRWIFIIEGIVTAILGIVSYFIIIDFPDMVLVKNKGFLTAEEVEIIKARIDRDRDDSQADPLTWGKVGTHLSDGKLWAFAFMFMNSTMPAYAFSYFLPIILQLGMGYKAHMAQILTAPPFVFAVITGMGFAVLSDKLRMRAPAILAQSLMVIIGLMITLYTKGNAPRYFGIFIGLAGAQGNVPAVLSWQSNNIRMNSKRSVGSALQVGFGAIGGIFASTVFRQKDQPRYIYGMWATMGCQFLTLILLVVLTFHFRASNAKVARGEKVIEGQEGFTYTY